jgi:hypothetical protein
MKALLLLTALSLAMLGCGGDDATTAGTTDGDPGATASTDLTITVDPGAGGEAVTYSLTCGPAGGDHPDPEAACTGLDAATADETKPLNPTPANQICTEIYGGDQTAVIEGTLNGEPLRTELSRTNGCEIARWDALQPVLVEPGGVQVD